MKSAEVVRLSYPQDEKGLVPTGDWHLGHERCNLEGIHQVLRDARDQGDAILLMGDLGDYGLTGSVGASAYEQKIQPQDQADQVLELLEDYRDLVVGVITGNHEERVRVRTGFDVSRQLAKDLGVPYLGFGGTLRLSVGGTGFTVFARHGKSGAATVGGVINVIKKYRDYLPEADVYLMGHVHQMLHYPSEVRKYDTRNKAVKPAVQHFVVTGHFLDYEDSYAERGEYAPGTQGSPRIVFTAKPRKVQVLL